MIGFDDKQLAELRAPLSREHVKGRSQAGRQVSYIEGWHVIAEANRIFGFDAWDRETVECRCVSEKPTKIGQNKDRDGFRVAYVGKVRVTVRSNGATIVREGTGYGSGIDADMGEAHESAIKECETDCMKRALMTFGNPFGLALYDKKMENVEAPARTPSRANGNGSALPPPHPEETLEARLQRVAVSVAKSLNVAPYDHAADLVMEDNKEDLAKMRTITARIFKTASGETIDGIETANRLHAMHNRKIAELRGGSV